MNVLVGILFLSTLVESITEYVFGKTEKMKPYLMYIALGLGVIVAIIYKVDLLLLLGVTSGAPLVSQIITGLIIGRGSNYVNDLISKFQK